MNRASPLQRRVPTCICPVRIHVELLARIHCRPCPHTDNDGHRFVGPRACPRTRLRSSSLPAPYLGCDPSLTKILSANLPQPFPLVRFLLAVGYALLACRWHCSLIGCMSALSRCGCSSLPAVGPLFHSPQLGLLFLRFPSTIRLVDLDLKLRVLVASRDFSLRAVPRVLFRSLLSCCSSARTFTCCAWRSFQSLASLDLTLHVAILLLWPALAGGLSVGVTVVPEFVGLWFLAYTDVILPCQTHCEGERSCFACSASASGASHLRLCCYDSSHLLPLRSFRPRALCVDEAVLDSVQGTFDETSRPQPFVISSLLDALCHRRHHLEHLAICLRSQACGELPRNGECV